MGRPCAKRSRYSRICQAFYRSVSRRQSLSGEVVPSGQAAGLRVTVLTALRVCGVAHAGPTQSGSDRSLSALRKAPLPRGARGDFPVSLFSASKLRMHAHVPPRSASWVGGNRSGTRLAFELDYRPGIAQGLPGQGRPTVSARVPVVRSWAATAAASASRLACGDPKEEP
jgi:hypothetical protein